MADGKVTIEVEIENIDEATKKVEKLIEKLKEAKTLADEIASMEIFVTEENLDIKVLASAITDRLGH
ncbi:hypothetical protein [Vagococcus fluvialis]|uniref:Uncharacterized protein n=1 Tax=Vagococcus fluvialis TaxID=2738 RepID=A0A7X6I3V0_9ENTE|nr:hypothetical protein [Vagococcus fluvialis]NKC68978.1 hypothetical protein [Vagococcus fluvialis]